MDFIVDRMGKNGLTEEKGKETRVHKNFPSKGEKNGLISPSLTQIDNHKTRTFFPFKSLFPSLSGHLFSCIISFHVKIFFLLPHITHTRRVSVVESELLEVALFPQL